MSVRDPTRAKPPSRDRLIGRCFGRRAKKGMYHSILVNSYTKLRHRCFSRFGGLPAVQRFSMRAHAAPACHRLNPTNDTPNRIRMIRSTPHRTNWIMRTALV